MERCCQSPDFVVRLTRPRVNIHPHSSVILPETAGKTEQLTQQLMAFVWKELFLFLKKGLVTQRTASFALISSLGAVTSLLFSLLVCNKIYVHC